MEWIDVKKELPKIAKPVLGCTKRDHICTITVCVLAHCTDGKAFWYSECDNEYKEMTHWMHLPPLPQQQDTDIKNLCGVCGKSFM